MKIKKRVPLIAIALVALILWKDITCRRKQAENPAVTAQPIPPSPSEKNAAISTTATPNTDLALSKLLASTSTQLREFERLRALPDDIEILRQSAEIENEFNNALDPANAAFLIKNMPPGFTDSYFGGLCLHKWSSAQRLDAAQWMESHPSDHPATAQALAAGWLAADRTSLTNYLDRLPPGLWKNNLATSASEDAFLAKEPATVIDLLSKTSGPSTRRDQLYEWNTTAWAMKDQPAAVRWVEQNAAPEQRQTLLAATAIGHAHTDPVAAANWAIAHVSDPATLKPAIHAIIRIWAANEHSAALRWVEQLPSGPFRDEAADGLIAVLKPELNSD